MSVTGATLNIVEKVPREKNWMWEQDMWSKVGMNTSREDFFNWNWEYPGLHWVRQVSDCQGLALCECKLEGGVESEGSLPMMVLWMDSILDVKKLIKELHMFWLLSRSNWESLEELFICSMSVMAFKRSPWFACLHNFMRIVWILQCFKQYNTSRVLLHWLELEAGDEKGRNLLKACK